MTTTRRRLLLVEDDASGRAALVDLLTLYGYDVHAAEDAAAAEFAFRWCPRIAIVDLGLSDRDGTEVVSRLVAQGIHVVAFSGWHHLRGDALAAGADAFVLKPAVPELMDVLGRLEQRIFGRKGTSASGR